MHIRRHRPALAPLTALLLTAAAAATAAPAHAAGPAPALHGPAVLALDPDRPADQGPARLQLDLDLPGGTTAQAKVTIDTAALGGAARLAAVSTSSSYATCTTTAAVVDCDVRIDGSLTRSVYLDLVPEPSAAPGTTGTVRTTAVSDGGSAALTTGVVVGGTRLTAAEVTAPAGLKPGDPWSPVLEITNHGQLTAPRLVVAFVQPVGVAFRQKYRNCEYGERAEPDPYPGPADRAVLCTVDSPVAPGETVRLDPLGLRITRDSAGASAQLLLRPAAFETGSWLRTHYRFTAGPANGPRLTTGKPPVPAPGTTPVADLADGGQSWTGLYAPVEHSADFRALGAWAPDTAAPGRGTLTVGLHNRGPASIGGGGNSGSSPVDVQVALDRRITVVAADPRCHRTPWLETDPGTALYSCEVDSWIPTGHRSAFAFTLAADPAAGLAAVVRLHNEFGEQDGHPATSMPWDHNPGNDSVTLRLDARPHGSVPPAATAPAAATAARQE
ncbi:hypothetical protein [Kitasatospora sp. MBT63]|uniref:hypothetical protein n=1 Tax=Kitasatospora sp. MBT63 TaxID=1444768 RepID=UPI00053A9380|nr:hypothetical protein [Kitasatospora sp. MBT63]